MSDAEAFRAKATLALRIFYALLALGLAVSGWLGWRFGRWTGLGIGIGIGSLLAAAAAFAATLLWAMTQDGA